MSGYIQDYIVRYDPMDGAYHASRPGDRDNILGSGPTPDLAVKSAEYNERESEQAEVSES